MKNIYDYPFIIIGAGASGFAAAIKAEQLGINTLMVSGGKVPIGGTCINVGCIPSKRLLETANWYWEAKQGRYESVTTSSESDFITAVHAKDTLVSGLHQKGYLDVIKQLEHVTVLYEDAQFIDAHTIQVGDKKITGEKFVISTGSSTYIPAIEGIKNIDYWTNIEALSPKTQPKSMIIIGGGPLGLEFAQMYHRFGTTVTVIQKAKRVADKEEPELAELLQQSLEDEGISIHTSAISKSIKKTQSGIELTVEVHGKEEKFLAERLLIATGVQANTDALQLDTAGVTLTKHGGIATNIHLQTSVEHIYAAGDVVDTIDGKPNVKLETTAGKEGFIAGSNALEKAGKELDLSAIPHAIFTSPTLASVGMTDAELQGVKGLQCSCRTVSLDVVPKAHVIEKTNGLIKLVINTNTEQVLGIHMVGIYAAEIISVAQLIVKQKMTLTDIIESTFIFPTVAEGLKWAAQSFKKDISKMSCCTE